MAFIRQVGEFSPQESLMYSYWITVLQLLQIGISWEAIKEFTEDEVTLIMGVSNALEQREADQQAQSMAASNQALNTRI